MLNIDLEKGFDWADDVWGVTSKDIETARNRLARPGQGVNLRKWLSKVSEVHDGRTVFLAWIAKHDGYSKDQLKLLDTIADFACSKATFRAAEAGFDLTASGSDRRKKEVTIVCAVASNILIETASVDELVQFGYAYLELMCAVEYVQQKRDQLFEDSDYKFRNLAVPEQTKWVVYADDRRTKSNVAEDCTDEADAKERFALMKAHAYRFTEISISDPKDQAEMRARYAEFCRVAREQEAASASPSKAWPFPT